MTNNVNEKNIDRFDGYSELYHSGRPNPPEIILKSALMYAPANPQVVVDIGCGTGLSTQLWKDTAETIIGIDPNEDMLSEAGRSVVAANISFKKGISNDTGLPDNYADIVTVAQAFHWFDIDNTLTEVYRILKPGGVLAIYDYDNPPSVDWVVEKACLQFRDKGNAICAAQAEPVTRTDKNSFIKILNAFGKFSFVKEIVCHSEEIGPAEKIIGFSLSQGYAQDALKFDPSFQREIDVFCDAVRSRLSGECPILFSYRLRLAVK